MVNNSGRTPYWTPERLEPIRRLYDEGLSYTKIGARFGLTRSVISGIVDRQDWPRRNQYVKSANWKKQARAPKLEPKTTKLELPLEPAPELLPPEGPMNDFPPNGTCKYPSGEMSKGNYQCCGHEAVSGTSWCAYHERKVFNVLPGKKSSGRFARRQAA